MENVVVCTDDQSTDSLATRMVSSLGSDVHHSQSERLDTVAQANKDGMLLIYWCGIWIWMCIYMYIYSDSVFP